MSTDTVKLSEEDAALVQIAIEQWERIRAAYAAGGVQHGLAVYARETAACRQQERLCRLREEHDLERGDTMAAMAICRRCPVVLATRRTCFWNIEREWAHDIEDTLNDSQLAQGFAQGIINFLKGRVLSNG